ncbi:Acetyltransferase (isoleucine patch superfamily) [Flavobacterium defluvii]|uniref:Acetyltransferase (Isoleucine patch superfamily) n=1 Tax=Flavobacterium defluvii TaxID=370979 RepID=A0A1M5NVC1_9FLAO|nr:Acetyltransferase (isoleucine patch superfamily) [Flavobacterium defluvii]
MHEKNHAILKSKEQNLLSKFNNDNALIGENTRIFNEAGIHNNLGDRTKIVLGNNCDIRGELLIFGHGGEIIIGDYSFIGERTKIWSAKKISIGNRVLISHNVNIHDNNSHPLDSKLRHEDFKYITAFGLKKESDLNEKEIIIEDDVWIGFNSTIMKGVKIGKGAIIAANTIITKDVPEYAVCAGNPMQIIKYTT